MGRVCLEFVPVGLSSQRTDDPGEGAMCGLDGGGFYEMGHAALAAYVERKVWRDEIGESRGLEHPTFG